MVALGNSGKEEHPYYRKGEGSIDRQGQKTNYGRGNTKLHARKCIKDGSGKEILSVQAKSSISKE